MQPGAATPPEATTTREASHKPAPLRGARRQNPLAIRAQDPSASTPPGPQLRWNRGDVLLDEYQVEDILGQGGMGIVYRVKHRHSGEQFAVKMTTLDAQQRQKFLDELQVWIDLPAYPHLTACRFFRTVEESVVIFAEYVNGGSLLDWIRNQRWVGSQKTLFSSISGAVRRLHQLPFRVFPGII